MVYLLLRVTRQARVDKFDDRFDVTAIYSLLGESNGFCRQEYNTGRGEG